MRYQKMRRLAGNLCLFLMASMILLAVAMLGGPCVALAQQVDKIGTATVTYVDVSGDGSQQPWTISFVLTPDTDISYASLLINIVVYEKYDETTSRTAQYVYQDVYGQLEAGTAISVVYGNVYEAQQGFPMPSPLEALPERVSITGQVYKSVYITVILKPPRPSAGGGAVVSPGVVSTPTDSGILTVDKASGIASFTPVAERLSQQVEQFAATAQQTGTRTFNLVDARSSGVPRLELSLPSDILDTLSRSPGSQWVEYIGARAPDVEVELPFKEILEQVAAFDRPEVVGGALPAGGAAGLRVVLAATDEAESSNVLRNAPPEAGSQVASRVYDLELHVTRFGQTVGRITTLERPMVARFGYSVEPGLNETHLTSYRLVDGRWVPTGGWPVYRERKVYTWLWGASKFAVMAYDKSFEDVKGHWAQQNVEVLAGRRVIKGVTDTTFEPESPVTRAQFAALTVRLLGLPERKPSQATFADVAQDDWFFGAVETAASFGIVRGMGDGTFRPNEKITREQLAVMVVNAMRVAGMPGSLQGGELESVLGAFADAGQLSSWAREQAAIAAKHGIVKGRAPGTLEPRADATRAEASTMLVRLLAYLGRY
ncbi:MAG: S-layer homology domain-containing protein [Bacillota bacterium]